MNRKDLIIDMATPTENLSYKEIVNKSLSMSKKDLNKEILIHAFKGCSSHAIFYAIIRSLNRSVSKEDILYYGSINNLIQEYQSVNGYINLISVIKEIKEEMNSK